MIDYEELQDYLLHGYAVEEASVLHDFLSVVLFPNSDIDALLDEVYAWEDAADASVVYVDARVNQEYEQSSMREYVLSFIDRTLDTSDEEIIVLVDDACDCSIMGDVLEHYEDEKRLNFVIIM